MADPARDRSKAPHSPDQPDRRSPYGQSPVSETHRPPRLSMRSGYSFFVGTMKIVLPALVVGIILLVLIWPRIMPEESQFRLGVSDLAPDSAGELTMVNPRFQGRDEEGQPFSLMADKAIQVEADSGHLRLTNPEAEITLNSDAWLALSAKTGLYNRQADTLGLSGGVSLFHDRGFEIRSNAATVDLKAGEAHSAAPVQGQGPSGNFTAEGFRILDQGATIQLTGHSKLTVYPSQFED